VLGIQQMGHRIGQTTIRQTIWMNCHATLDLLIYYRMRLNTDKLIIEEPYVIVMHLIRYAFDPT
jgi:hypothetical protein